jgi:hypothetical protein
VRGRPVSADGAHEIVNEWFNDASLRFCADCLLRPARRWAYDLRADGRSEECTESKPPRTPSPARGPTRGFLLQALPSVPIAPAIWEAGC